MLYRLYYSTCIILHPFILATLTAIAICQYFKYPFISPKYSIMKITQRLGEMMNGIPILLGQSVLFTYMIYPNIQPNSFHTEIESFWSMVLYSLLIEANYYAYHRWIHHSHYYALVHKKHHQVVETYPFDTFFLTYLDDLALVVSLGLPLFVIQVTYIEQFLVLYFYITCSYLSHSKLFWKRHSIHHRYIHCNYCILFPVFDILFNTYRK